MQTFRLTSVTLSRQDKLPLSEKAQIKGLLSTDYLTTSRPYYF